MVWLKSIIVEQQQKRRFSGRYILTYGLPYIRNSDGFNTFEMIEMNSGRFMEQSRDRLTLKNIFPF